MAQIEAALPTLDGVAWFNRLYQRMTERVSQALQQGVFTRRRFIERLDVVFAHLYLQAVVDNLLSPPQVPRAWAPLFDARGERRIAPIQFALAGMNAHINRDLPIALVRTWGELGVEPSPSARLDYTRVDQVLEETEAEIKVWFATGFVGVIDEVFGQVDDVVATWSLARAREAAWVEGETLWFLRPVPPLTAALLSALDRTVGFAGRGLLIRTAV
jgi:hypothetical protein